MWTYAAFLNKPGLMRLNKKARSGCSAYCWKNCTMGEKHTSHGNGNYVSKLASRQKRRGWQARNRAPATRARTSARPSARHKLDECLTRGDFEIATDPFDTGGAGQFFVQSSDIEVSSGAVLPLAMVLNELCTNAVSLGRSRMQPAR